MATVCEWFGLKTTQTVFAGLASKPVVMVSDGLTTKPVATTFSGLASKPIMTVSGGLASKPAVTVFSSLASKLVVAVSPGLALKPVVDFLVEPQNQAGGGFPVWTLNRQLCFGDLVLKITTTVSWFGSQNQTGFGLSVAPQNRGREVGTGHASRSSSFLRVEVSLARVFQSDLKTGGGVTTGGAHGTIMEVASETS
jgi:hypothetical protein